MPLYAPTAGGGIDKRVAILAGGGITLAQVVLLAPVLANQTLAQGLGFGRETLEGLGGIAPVNTGGTAALWEVVTDDSSNPGDWDLNSSNGEFTPSAAGEGSLADTYLITVRASNAAGQSEADITIPTTAGRYSVKPDNTELLSSYNDVDLTNGGEIWIRPGDIAAAARVTLPARAFLSECLIQSDGYVTDTDDRRLSIRPARMGAVTLEAGCQNVTIQGVEWQKPKGAEAQTLGVIHIENPSTNVSVLDNEVWCVSLEEEWLAGNLVNYSTSPLMLRGIRAPGDSTDPHDTLKINYNYVHDVERGVMASGFVDYECIGNIILDCFNNGTTHGGYAAVSAAAKNLIGDNYVMHIWAAAEDTPTPGNPSTIPHSAAGGSFDAAPEGEQFADVALYGNVFHVGWRRTKLHRDNDLPDPSLSATGVKFNDPTQTDSYDQIECADNIVVSAGICLEFTGADGINIYNCTLARDIYNNDGAPSTPLYYLQGAANSKIYRCIGAGFSIGVNDGGMEDGVSLVTTLDTLEGYGNYHLATDLENYFEGDPVKGFDLLDVLEVRAAFAPKTGTHPVTAAEKIGASVGYWSPGDTFAEGTWPAFSKPASAAGSANAYPVTVWDGATYGLLTGTLQDGGGDVENGQVFTFGWQGAFHADTDGVKTNLLASQFSTVEIFKTVNDTITVRAKNVGSTEIINFETHKTVTSADGDVSIVIVVDLSERRAEITIDNDLEFYFDVNKSADDDVINFQGPNLWRLHADAIGANIFKGDFKACYFINEKVDIYTVAGAQAILTAAGDLIDLGTNGENPTTNNALIMAYGDAAGFANQGDGGTIAVTGGTLTDGGQVIHDVNFPATAYSTSLGITAGPALIMAFKARVTDAGDDENEHFLTDGLTNTHVGLSRDEQAGGGNNTLAARLELVTGTVVDTIGGDGTTQFPDPNTEISVFVKCIDDYQEITINGSVEEAVTNDTGGTNVKPPQFINNTDGSGTAAQSIDFIGPIWIFTADDATPITYDDFFDENDDPILFSDTIRETTAAWFRHQAAADWNEESFMVGEVSDN